MLFSVEQAFVGRNEKRTALKTPAWETNRNLVLLLLRGLLLAFIVLLQNKHTTLAQNGENLISSQPRISAHLE